MTTILCSACRTTYQYSKTKCKECQVLIHQDPIDDELEKEFLDIDNAELNGTVIKLENLDELDKTAFLFDKSIGTTDQVIKEEPELQIEPESTIDSVNTGEKTEGRPYKYECNKCNKWFKRKTALLCHRSAAHQESGSESEHSYTNVSNSMKKKETSFRRSQTTEATPIRGDSVKCDWCTESFSNKLELKNHQKVCAKKDKFFCAECNISFTHSNNFMKHIRSKEHNSKQDHRRFLCIFCGEKFAHQIDMTRHKSKVHIEEESKLLKETARLDRSDGRLKYICLLCNKMSKFKTAHTEHLKVHKSINNIQFPAYPLCEGSFAKCELCGAEFTSQSWLVKHMMLHTNERPYKCEICDVTYRHKNNLKKHQLKHTGERPFKCEYCGSTFALRETHKNHVRIRHTKEKPYKCQHCNKSFGASYLLNVHARKDHNIDTNTKPKVQIFVERISTNEGKNCQRT